MPSRGRAPRGLSLSLLVPAMSLLFVTTTAATAEAPDLARDFDAAIVRLLAASRLRPSGPLGFDGYWVEAVAIARAHGTAAARPLGDRIGGPNRAAEKLALMTLAALSHDPAAVAVLSSRLKEWDFRDSAACMALTYATPVAAMAVVDGVMAGRVRQPGVLVAMSTVARFFGEPGRDAMIEASLKAALADGAPISEWDRNEIAANLAALRQRLARPLRERAGWSRQDLTVWRAVKSMPGSISENLDIENRATLVCAMTWFTSSFLKGRLAAPAIASIELRLIVKIARNQRRAEVVPELAKLVDGVWPPSMDVYHALASIRTRDALASLERFVVNPEPGDIDHGEGPPPPRTEASNRERLAINLCEILSRRGDRETLNLMETLADDDSLSPAIQAACAKARDFLRERYQTKGD